MDVTVRVEAVPERAVEVSAVRLNVDGTRDKVKVGDLGLGEVTNKGDGTRDLLELGEADNGLEGSVVGDDETTVDLGELGERQVSELAVGDDVDTTGSRELGHSQAADRVVVDVERRVDRLQLRHRDVANGPQGDVRGPLELGERDRDLTSVVRDLEVVRHRGEVGGDVLDVTVVVDIEAVALGKSDAAKRGETSVGDVHIAGLLDTSVELELAELRKGDPVNGANLGELGEAEGVQGVEDGEVEHIADLGERRGRERGQRADVGGVDATGQLLDTIDGDGGEVTAEVDITVKGLARADAVDVALRGRIEIRRAVNVRRLSCLLVCFFFVFGSVL